MRITDTMEAFVAGESEDFKVDCSARLASHWPTATPGSLSATFALLWSSRARDWTGETNDLLSELIGPGGSLASCRLERWSACPGGGRVPRSFQNAVLIECDLSNADLRGARFFDAWLESVSLEGANVSGVDFTGASLLDVDVTDANLAGADFRNVESGLSLRDQGRDFSGDRAMGLLAHRGAQVGEVDPVFVAMSHPSYEIAKKIARKLCEGGASQLLGLSQRGASARDPQAAQRFIDMLVSIGYASYDKSGSARTVDLTVAGRRPVRQLAEETGLDSAIAGYFAPRKR